MTLLGKLIVFFPVLCYTLIMGCLYYSLEVNAFVGLGSLLFVCYFFPVIFFRVHNNFFPLKNNVTDIDAKEYRPWWGSYCIQRVYYDLPFLESILRSLPGAYSFWLRLWGSKIGKHVHWSPLVEVCDRSLLTIGDHVVFGHRVVLISHAITPIDKKNHLLVERITIGSRSFIGAGSGIGPGCVVPDSSFLPLETRLLLRSKWKNE